MTMIAFLILSLATNTAVGQLQFTNISVHKTQQFPAASGSYSVSNVVVDGNPEIRLYFGSQHFLSVLTNNGVFDLRPHPSVDRNGWGSSLYMQPFISGATLHYTTVSNISATTTGIVVSVGGYVSKDTASTFGTWNMPDLCLTYTASNKTAHAHGTYRIVLAALLNLAGGDLNLYRIASNFLDDVPLIEGTNGDTGDMAFAEYNSITGTAQWIPPEQPGHFPGPDTNYVSINAVGNFNKVDTLAQGLRAIQAAYKPSLQVDLTALTNGCEMRPGFIYTTSESTNSKADNVGITPVVLASSPTTNFAYDVSFQSTALPLDGAGSDASFSARYSGTNKWQSVEVYYLEHLPASNINRLVGFLNSTDFTNYTGTLEVPLAPDSDGKQGFFILAAPYK